MVSFAVGIVNVSSTLDDRSSDPATFTVKSSCTAPSSRTVYTPGPAPVNVETTHQLATNRVAN